MNGKYIKSIQMDTETPTHAYVSFNPLMSRINAFSMCIISLIFFVNHDDRHA